MPDGAYAYPAYQNALSATPTLFLAQISQRGVVSPLKSANRSGNDKVWTPWMADRGEPRQDVESSRPQSGTREVSAVRSTDFLAGPRGIDKGSAAASLVPFTAEVVNETPQRLVNGTIPPIRHECPPIAGWRYAYPAYGIGAASLPHGPRLIYTLFTWFPPTPWRRDGEEVAPLSGG